MNILAIDPGPQESGWCLFNGERVADSGICANAEMLGVISALDDVVSSEDAEVLAIEMIASYGMAVGKDVFETCVWIGRFMQAWHAPEQVKLVYRKDVKMHLCGSMKAKDTNIRQALVDALGGVGTKKEPGPLYGVKGHAWSALAVAKTALEAMR